MTDISPNALPTVTCRPGFCKPYIVMANYSYSTDRPGLCKPYTFMANYSYDTDRPGFCKLKMKLLSSMTHMRMDMHINTHIDVRVHADLRRCHV